VQHGGGELSELADRLRGRFAEIEEAILACIKQLSEPIGDEDPAYLEGMRHAVVEALSYGIEGIEGRTERAAAIPPGAAMQARRAARAGVRLDTVLRRYAAGNKVLEEFIVAEAGDLPGQVLCRILRDQGPRVDRLMGAVAAEYEEERRRAKDPSVNRFTDRVLRLLAGGSEGVAEINYDFDAWHTGLILLGRGADSAARVLVKRLGYRSLHLERDTEMAWAWLGSSGQPAIATLERSLADNLPVGASLAIGEPRAGLEGWRLTHREAQVALQVMLQRPQTLTRGSDVALLAGVLRDDTLVRSLLDTYLGPLETRGNSGRALRETLAAYFAAGGNAAAAAVSLGVTRHTVQRRIRAVEQSIGHHLHSCHAELQVALRLDELDWPTGTRNSV
jgi:hypothetical protein